jgi:Arc/MetJ-type ribon-helix-helix transcriptional regulator
MPKVKITVSLDLDLVQWVQEKVKDKTFGSLSHGVNVSIQRLKDSTK